MIDYKGIAAVVRRSGEIKTLHADVVYSKDEFDCAYGSKGHLIHKPSLDEDRGRLIAAYSFVTLSDGTDDFILMSRFDIEKIRKRSKTPDNGPWVTDFDQMAAKSVFRRHSKWLPWSTEDMRRALDVQDRHELPEGDGAFELAAATIGAETIERLESQIEEQGREARKETGQETGQEEKKKVSTESQNQTPSDDRRDPEPPANGRPWVDRRRMEQMFEVLKGVLGDIMYYNVLSTNGVGGQPEDLELKGEATLKAYQDLLEASQGGREPEPTNDKDEPDFTPRKRK
jgi:recombination protein RecT